MQHAGEALITTLKQHTGEQRGEGKTGDSWRPGYMEHGGSRMRLYGLWTMCGKVQLSAALVLGGLILGCDL